MLISTAVTLACGPVTQFSNVWKSPALEPHSMRKLLVVAIAETPTGRRSFEDSFVRELAADHPILLAALDALLTIRLRLIDEIELLDRQLVTMTQHDSACRRLMTIPGIGPLAAQTFTAVIDDPARFRRSSDIGAYLGLTPRRWQSGETDISGHITHAGDATLENCLFAAASEAGILLGDHLDMYGTCGSPIRWTIFR